MKAVVVKKYGGPEVAVVTQRPDPQVGPNDVRVRVEAVAVTAGDARLRGGRFPRGFRVPARLALGFRGPRRPVLGSAFSGVVDQIGAAVTGFRVGDEVAGMNGIAMGLHAQFASIAATRIVPKPDSVDHEAAAAALFGGTTALHFLCDRVRPGSSVLVNGASGAVGSSALQLATLAGARVTAVTSAVNAPLARQLGAAATIDYRAQRLQDLPRHTFDLVFDAVGNIDRALGLRLATPEGFVVLAVADFWNTIRAGGRVLANPSQEAPSDISHLLALLADGRLDPVARTLGGLDSVVEAYRVIDSGRKIGNLVLRPWE